MTSLASENNERVRDLAAPILRTKKRWSPSSKVIVTDIGETGLSLEGLAKEKFELGQDLVPRIPASSAPTFRRQNLGS